MIRTDSIEVAFIYFGCSSCFAANKENMKPLLPRVSENIKMKFRDISYTTIGISNETNQIDGLKYLQEIFTFDEIALGNEMRNTAIQKYVWNKYDGEYSASTPQVIISIRVYLTRTNGDKLNILPEIGSEKILRREIGVSNIKKLLNQDYLDKIFQNEV